MNVPESPAPTSVQVQRLKQLIELQQRERGLLAYEIHDGLVQDLVGAQLMLEGIKPRIDPSLSKEIDALASSLQGAITEARRLIRDMRPIMLGGQGWAAAIETLAAEQTASSGPAVKLSIQSIQRPLEPLTESVLFRIVQESLQNIVRHSKATEASIDIQQAGQRMVVRIADDGIGFDPATIASDRYGIEGIQQRARLLGGLAVIESTPGQGTKIHVELPVE